jgi:hypothetical protein
MSDDAIFELRRMKYIGCERLLRFTKAADLV